MKCFLTRSRRRSAAAFVSCVLVISASAESPGVVLVRHAPAINGTLNGSVQQMSAEDVTLNGGGTITGDWLVPGTPALRLNGKPTFGGTTTGAGDATPVNYTLTLNGGAHLGHAVTATNAVTLPTVTPPSAPTDTRTVTVSNAAQPNVDFTGLRDLTVNGNAGQVSVPAGNYGNFTANAGSGFTLGVAGSTTLAVYSFQHLTLNGSATLQVVGPVVITLANDFSPSAAVGNALHQEWLVLRLATGSLTLNGKAAFHGYVTAPVGSVIVNGGASLTGGVIADRLTLNGSATLDAVNLAPTATVIAPASGTVITAPIAALNLKATAGDADGYLTKVEFFSGVQKLGEANSAPYQLTWTAIPAGTYSITARATDNSGAAVMSDPVTLIANAPPTVSLTGPADNFVCAIPGAFTLTATAADSDGTVAKVEFFEGGAKIGESSTAPYQLAVSGLSTGTYTFTARATDNYGASTDSLARNVIVEIPPTAAVVAPPTVARGTGVILTATATDADGSIAKVEFYRGPTLIGTLTTAAGDPPAYVFTDTDALMPGSYRYTVRSYDNLGLYADSTVAAVAVLATLPYTADFEDNEGYALGAIGGQLGWTASVGSASVTDEAAYNGVHSIALAPGTPPVRVAQAFAPYPGHDVVFMDFFARPVAESDLSTSTTFDVESARFAFAQNGTNAVLNVFQGDGAGGGTWQPTAFSAPIGADNQLQTWTRLTARLDFAHKTWDLYAGGNMVAADVPFRDNTATYLSSFAVRGDAATNSRLDYIFAGAENPLFADTNNNGIDDAWETAHGLALTTVNRFDDPDGDGSSNVLEYINGTDPQDFYNGEAPVITSLVSADGKLGPDGLVSVRVTKSDGTLLRNAPVTFRLNSGPAQVGSAPTGPFASVLSVRTDASGVGSAYFKFNNAAAASLTVTAHAGAADAPITILLNAPTVDIDGNGLPDDWEVKYFGHTGVDPTADPDEDGISNADELKNGTDPTDYYNGVVPVMTTLNGANGELGPDGSLSVKVTDQTGNPFVNAPASFRAIVGGHLLAPAPDAPASMEIHVRTDTQGIAKAFVILGSSTP